MCVSKVDTVHGKLLTRSAGKNSMIFFYIIVESRLKPWSQVGDYVSQTALLLLGSPMELIVSAFCAPWKVHSDIKSAAKAWFFKGEL